MPPASRVPPPPEGLQIGARKRGAHGERYPQPTIPPCRVSTDRLNRKDSQLAAALEGKPDPTPATKTLPHSYPKTRFRRERAPYQLPIPLVVTYIKACMAIPHIIALILYNGLPVYNMKHVNGSHHGDNPLLKPAAIQIATKLLPGPATRELLELIICLKTMSKLLRYVLLEYELQLPLTISLKVRTTAYSLVSSSAASSTSESELQATEKILSGWSAGHLQNKIIEESDSKRFFPSYNIGRLHEDKLCDTLFTRKGKYLNPILNTP